MKRKVFLFVIILSLAGGILTGDTAALADKFEAYVNEYFPPGESPSLSVARYDNHSGLSDFAAQRLYQILIARLEKLERFDFRDTLSGITDGRGQFNRADRDVDYYLYLRLMRNRSRLGIGIAVYSVNLETIVDIKYIENGVSGPEREILTITNLGFESVGFSRLTGITVSGNLMDIALLEGYLEGEVYLFFYPDRLDLMEPEGSQMIRQKSLPLQWDGAYYPAKYPEGRITLFQQGASPLIALGTNFSGETKVFEVTSAFLEEKTPLDFLPLATLTMNGRVFLVGARYQPGANFFTGTLLLTPIAGNDDESYEKIIPSFFDITFLKQKDQLRSFYLVDRQYRLCTFGADFEQVNIHKDKIGAGLVSLSGRYLAYSDYTQTRDRLQLADIGEGGFNPEFQEDIEGEIRFLREGRWAETHGVWILVAGNKGADPFKLLFFGKSHEN